MLHSALVALFLAAASTRAQEPIADLSSSTSWRGQVNTCADFRLELAAPALLCIGAACEEADVAIEFSPAEGLPITSDDDGGPATDASLVLSSVARGVYRLRVSTHTSSPVQVAISIARTLPPMPNARESALGEERACRERLARLTAPPPDLRAKLLVLSAEASSALGDHVVAIAALEPLLAQIDRTAPRSAILAERAEAQLGLALAYVSRFEESRVRLDAAIISARARGARAEEARWLGYYGGTFLYAGKTEEAAITMDRALEAAAAAGDAQLEMHWSAQSGRCWLLLGRLDRGLPAYERALACAISRHDVEQELKLSLLLVRLQFAIGRYEEARNLLDRTRTLARDRDRVDIIAEAAAIAAQGEILLGAYGEALDSLLEAEGATEDLIEAARRK